MFLQHLITPYPRGSFIEHNSLKEKMSMIPSINPFEDSLSLPQFSRENPSFLSRDIDWKETPEAHVFRADMTGLNEEEVKVEVDEGGVLQISGERNMQREDKNDTMHRVECSSGRFMRSFTLPANARMNQVKASMNNGVLTVTVGKDDTNMKAIPN